MRVGSRACGTHSFRVMKCAQGATWAGTTHTHSLGLRAFRNPIGLCAVIWSVTPGYGVRYRRMNTDVNNRCNKREINLTRQTDLCYNTWLALSHIIVSHVAPENAGTFPARVLIGVKAPVYGRINGGHRVREHIIHLKLSADSGMLSREYHVHNDQYMPCYHHRTAQSQISPCLLVPPTRDFSDSALFQGL
jgi:hypothetical protein